MLAENKRILSFCHQTCQNRFLDFGDLFYYHHVAMTELEIRKHLTTQLFGRKIYTFDLIDSTNLKVRSLAADGESEGVLVIAEEQTSGKGRMGRRWHSDPGQNLTFSILLRPRISPERVGLLSLLAGVGVAEAVEQITTCSPDCKWPNDLLLSNRKFCGILSETAGNGTAPAVVMGIGINVNKMTFPDELREGATSLAIETGRMVDRPILLAATLRNLESLYRMLHAGQAAEIIRRWKTHSRMMGKTVGADRDGGTTRGIASDIADDGSLVIRTAEGDRRVYAGEVTILHND